VGLATLPSLRATMARWKAEDEKPAEPASELRPPVELYPGAPACSVPARERPVPAREPVAA